MLRPIVLLVLLCSLAPITSAQEADSLIPDPALYQSLTYRMVGPTRGGRVTAVSGYAGEKTTLYFGSTGGGVWKSTNHGLTYRNVSDGFFKVGSIGSVAVAPSDSNVIYVGTGSASIRSNVSTGRGVYKSLDAGATWLNMGLPETGQIGDLAIDPTNPQRVFLAALGHAFGPNPERGVYRSEDGGESWEQVLHVSDSTGAIAIEMHPEDPNTLYAAMWHAERKPWTIISGGPGSGIYKTTDGGATWMPLSEGLPTSTTGKIGLALSPANPSRLYALIEAAEGQGGLYRSDDEGATFERVNDTKSLLNRPFYYTYITADPLDQDVLYVSNESFYRLTDGGTTTARIQTRHGDHHALWIHPEDPDYLFQGNDGGASVSVDGGNTWSSIYNQPTAEMYHVVVDNQYPYWLYGEQQDNSTIMVPSLPPTAGFSLDRRQNWKAVAGCETGPIQIHPDNPNIIYGGCKGRFSRFNHETGQEQQYWVYPHFNYGHAASEMPFRFQRTAPIELSPHDPSVIYHGSQFVHRTTNEGLNWETISPDLTANEPDKQGYSGGPITRDITGEEIYSAIYQIRVSDFDPDVIWTGSNDGLIYVTRDGGENWTGVTPPDLPPGGRVQTLEPSPHARGRLFAAIYRYMLDDWKPYIYRTNDFGETWALLTDTLSQFPQDEPTRVIREDPQRRGLLYAGTEFGMHISFDDGRHWQPFQQNLPHTPITDIQVYRDDIILSTMGRSFWIMDDVTPLHYLGEEATAAVELLPPREFVRMRWSSFSDDGDGQAPAYPDYGPNIHYVLNEVPDEPILLEILNAGGEVIRAFTSDSAGVSQPVSAQQRMRRFIRTPSSPRLPTNPGLNRFTWNARYASSTSLTRGGAQVRGPLAPPGQYQARLTVGATVLEQPIILLPDPRMEEEKVSPADMEAQLLLNLEIRDAISALQEGVGEIRAVLDQLASVHDELDPESTLEQRVNEMILRLDGIENALVQTEEGKVGAQLKPMLMRQLTYLYGMLQWADQAPGEDAYLRLQDIQVQLNAHLENIRTAIDTDLPLLNIALREAGQDEIESPIP